MLDPKNIYRSKRKTLALFIDVRGNLIIKAPINLPDRKIMEFVSAKQDWIAARQRQIVQNSYINRSVITYNTFLFLGAELTPVLSTKAKTIIRQNNALVIPARFTPENMLKKVEKWYRVNALSILQERAQYFSNRLKLYASEIGINNNKTRWGSCDSRRRINLNWRAVMLPPNLFDYIVVHEFCHLLEFNHTKNFWGIVETILPDWRAVRKHLKQMNWILGLFRKH